MAARVLFFPLVSFAWPSMKRSARLMRGEFERTAENTKLLGQLAKDAKTRVFGPAQPPASDAAGETFAAAMAKRPGAERRGYLTFLARKRSALSMACFFVSIGLLAIGRGTWQGVFPLVIGGGLSLEFAWLAEFRLWQLRGLKLSAEEGATLRDFWMEPGAWRGALKFEAGYALSPDQRRYRRWLWLKRLALAVAVSSVLVALEQLLTHGAPGDDFAWSGAGFLLALMTELRLSALRKVIGLRTPAFAAIRPEMGACYEDIGT
jgi:hypothetical protein